MGNGIVNELKKEFDIADEWLGLEIHPEIPSTGEVLAERYGSDRFKEMMKSIRRAGQPYGITFGDLNRIPNSRLSLEAAEFAKDHNKFHEFHESIFFANFVELLDIGNIEVLLTLADQSGLDRNKLKNALQEGTYISRLAKYAVDAKKLSISATPTFIVNDREIITGAQSIDVFRAGLKKYENK